ncbi:hypothetical protein [Streptomyces sp. NPDC048248]|uniref:WXG100-like domain-containing protein n=1 Tax=Streptomyces sp. NPDC048248 TaxID=3365523 RepID=UPI003717B923
MSRGPNVDEDDYREMANAMREFAGDIDEGANETHTAIQSLVGSAGGSLAIEAMNAHWSKINGTHLKGLADCGRMAATAMDGVAILIEGTKIGALVQLGILAAEVIAAKPQPRSPSACPNSAHWARPRPPACSSSACSKRSANRSPNKSSASP